MQEGPPFSGPDPLNTTPDLKLLCTLPLDCFSHTYLVIKDS